jgi:hypothetical protein
MDMEGEVHAGEEAQAPVGEAETYLVFFARDPVDDALAGAIVDRVRGCSGAGWFDDAGAATPAERTTGGYVRARDVEEPHARELLQVARLLSADHAILVEVQWREELLGLLESGTWRPSSTSTRTT